jgi:hypothetical protein
MNHLSLFNLAYKNRFAKPGKAKFPWRLSHRKRNGAPQIVDASGLVVAEIVGGGQAAEQIIKSINSWASLWNKKEI